MSTFAAGAGNDALLVPSPNAGKVTFALVTDEIFAGAQKLFQRGQMFEGEWFMDTRVGMPYFRLILVKNPNESIVRSVFTQWLLSVDVVAKVNRITLQFARAARRLGMDFSATMVDGRQMTGGWGRPFIISGTATNANSATNNSGATS
jgi:hypothetical protein